MGVFKKIGDFLSNRNDSTEYNESEIFNVDNFNEWFCDPNNGAKYANSGIFLRIDKLSDSQIIDYMEKKWGIKEMYDGKWSRPLWQLVNMFHSDIQRDWLDKKSNKSKL